MAVQKHTYSIATDTANGKVDHDTLKKEIEAPSSGVIYGLAIPMIVTVNDVLDIYLKDNAEDMYDELLAVVNAHQGESTAEQPEAFAPQQSREGFRLCNRDFLLNTAIFDGIDSFEDLYVNPADNKRYDWGEMSFMGCYKKDLTESSEPMILCTDQADADANAILSVWDYVPRNLSDGSPTDIDILGGGLWVDKDLQGANNAELLEHQVYVISAPNIPSSLGGRIKFFDGYLLPYKDRQMQAQSSRAIPLDATGAGGVEGGRIRVWLYYPAGKKQSHIFRLNTFRKAMSQ